MSWSVGTVYTKPWFWKKVSEVVIDSELGCANWVVMGVLTFFFTYILRLRISNINTSYDVGVTYDIVIYHFDRKWFYEFIQY